MTARLDPAEWLWLGGLTFLAAIVGLLAGIEPKLAIAASLACGFVLVVFMDLGLGVALFTLFSFLEVLGASPVVSVGKLAGILLVLAWIALVLTRPDAKSDFTAVHTGMTAVICAFLGWTLLSVVWAESPSTAFGTFTRYALNAMLFLIVFTAIRTKRQAVYVAAAFVAGAVLTVFYGLFTGPPASDAVAYGSRLAGAGLGANELAASLLAAIALSAAVAGNLKRYPGLRLTAVAAGVICLLGLFFTASRGGILGLGVALAAALLLAGRWRTRVAIAAVLIAVGTFYYFAALAPPDARDRVLEGGTEQEKLLEPRTTLWEVAERMARDNFVMGVGAGNFPVSSVHYLLEPGAVARSDQIIGAPNVAHNTYLEVLAENGIVGLSLFGGIILFSLVCAMKAARVFNRKGDRGGEILARALAIGLLGLLTANFFQSEQYGKDLWLMLGLAPALLSVARTEPTAQPAD